MTGGWRNGRARVPDTHEVPGSNPGFPTRIMGLSYNGYYGGLLIRLSGFESRSARGRKRL